MAGDLPPDRLAELRGTGIVYIAESFEDAWEPPPEPEPRPSPGPMPPGAVRYTMPLGVVAEPVWVPARPPFMGHWEGFIDGRAALFENGPGWDTAEEAIAWGRERSPRVLVRLGLTPPLHYSAGDGPIADSNVRPWPPE